MDKKGEFRCSLTFALKGFILHHSSICEDKALNLLKYLSFVPEISIMREEHTAQHSASKTWKMLLY